MSKANTTGMYSEMTSIITKEMQSMQALKVESGYITSLEVIVALFIISMVLSIQFCSKSSSGSESSPARRAMIGWMCDLRISVLIFDYTSSSYSVKAVYSDFIVSSFLLYSVSNYYFSLYLSFLSKQEKKAFFTLGIIVLSVSSVVNM